MMFQTLRSRLLLSYGVLIVLILLVVAFILLLVLAVSQRARLVPQFQQLTQDYRAIARGLRDLPEGQRDIRDPAAQEQIRAIVESSGSRLLFLSPNFEVLLDSRGRLAGETLTLNFLSENIFAGLDTGPGAETQLRFVRFADRNGQQWVGQLRALPGRITGRDVLLLNAIPEATPLSTFRESFMTPLAWAGAGAFLIAIFLAWLISRSVARPLQTMSSAAEAIAQGNYDDKIVPRGPREVRSLAESFNWMADQVQSTQQAQQDFVANVSHDLKTPLTSIQGWSQAILDGAAADPAQLDRAAAVIHNESARMSRMVNQLLLLARLEAGRVEMEMRPLNLLDVASEVQRSLLFQAQEQDVDLDIESAEEAIIMQGNLDGLVQLFTNLVQNSLNSMDAGGKISLVLGHKADRRPFLAVVDNGRGIPQEELSRVFERFYQVDKSRSGVSRGTGLGLSIVQTIAEAHGAIVQVESVAGLGSRFEIIFPMVNTQQSIVN
ncbi:MAG: HAMP domain-containing sensor histidine kinase [Ardenticatenaceae bacterium]|nr:HAMP domain-containing sensor histidine kinase [Ardenticatenaceae bacterium]